MQFRKCRTLPHVLVTVLTTTVCLAPYGVSHAQETISDPDFNIRDHVIAKYPGIVSREAGREAEAYINEQAAKQNGSSDDGSGGVEDAAAEGSSSSGGGGGDDTWETVGIVAGAVVVVSIVGYLIYKHFKAPDSSAQFDHEQDSATAIAQLSDSMSLHISHGIFGNMEADAYDAEQADLQDLDDIGVSLRYAF